MQARLCGMPFYREKEPNEARVHALRLKRSARRLNHQHLLRGTVCYWSFILTIPFRKYPGCNNWAQGLGAATLL